MEQTISIEKILKNFIIYPASVSVFTILIFRKLLLSRKNSAVSVR